MRQWKLSNLSSWKSTTSRLKEWIALRAFPSTEGLSILSQDVTTRRESQDALRQNEEQFRRLADSMPVLAWMADANGWIYWFNKRWYEYTGSTPEQMEGWGWRSVHDPEQVEQVVERWTSSILTGEPFEMVFPLRSRSGEFRQFLTRGEPVRDASGKIFRWFGTNTDVTDQERQAENARRDQQRLQAALEASRTGTFHWALRSNNLEWDDNLDRLLGSSAATGERTLQRFLDAVNSEDLQAVVRAFHESASSGAGSRSGVSRSATEWRSSLALRSRQGNLRNRPVRLDDGCLRGHHGAQVGRRTS